MRAQCIEEFGQRSKDGKVGRKPDHLGGGSFAGRLNTFVWGRLLERACRMRVDWCRFTASQTPRLKRIAIFDIAAGDAAFEPVHALFGRAVRE